VIGTAAWLALLGAVLGALGQRVPGWMALVALWAFAGWHLFARYTVPR